MTWDYQFDYVDGAIRFITVEGLLALEDAEFFLLEWRDFTWDHENGARLPPYAAISHIWTSSPEVMKLSRNINRPLNIDGEEGSPHTISWHGLRQAALAARHLGCRMLWLDSICIHQNSPSDKKIQIPNMGNIYTNATAVIVMPGGVSAAQYFEIETEWATRAWTLQEATLCPRTYILGLDHVGSLFLNHDEYSFSMSTTTGCYADFDCIEGCLALADIRDILKSLNYSMEVEIINKRTGEVVREGTWRVQCLGNGAVVRAFAALLLAETPAMKNVGIWRSLWLRKSKLPQDTVYSMMSLLRVEIEPDYNRTREDLIAEVVRKTLLSLPSWLDIMEDDMHFDSRNGLFPPIPVFGKFQNPVFMLKGQLVAVEDYVGFNNYICPLLIKVLAPAVVSNNGDLVCAYIPRLSAIYGKKIKHAPLHLGASHAVLLGAVKLVINDNYICPGIRCFLIRKSKKGVWKRLLRHWLPSEYKQKGKKSHLRIGGSPGAEISDCNCVE
jgi:hypothetical protein